MLGALGFGYLMKKAMMSGHELIEILIKEVASLTLCNFFTLRKEKNFPIFISILQ